MELIRRYTLLLKLISESLNIGSIPSASPCAVPDSRAELLGSQLSRSILTTSSIHHTLHTVCHNAAIMPCMMLLPRNYRYICYEVGHVNVTSLSYPLFKYR